MAGTVVYVENLTVTFNGFKAIDKMNFCMNYGELRFLVGPNGAGKTTLLDVICGRLKPTSGRVIFKEDIDIAKKQEHELVLLGIGRKFQTPSVFTDLTVFENLDLALRRKKGILPALFHKNTAAEKERIMSILESVWLVDKMHLKAGMLSHGEKQRLEIGMLLVLEPELLLLDEPVAGLTKDERQKMGELLQTISRECSVLVVEHDMGFIRQFARRITVMHEGKVLSEGNITKVQSDPKVVEVYLGRGGDKPC